MKTPSKSAWILACVCASAVAQDDMDSVLEGFDDIPDYSDVIELSQDNPPQDFGQQAVTFRGSLALLGSYNLIDHNSSTGTDYGGLAKLRARAVGGAEFRLPADWRASIDLSAWHDFAYSLRDADYTPEVLDAYETRYDVPEGTLAGSLGGQWELKLGRQIAVFGFADQLRVLDVLNPLDNLEPGLAEVEDLRLAVGMLRIDHFSDSWRLSGFVTPEQRFSRNPPFGSDFYSIVNADGQALKFREIRPESFDSIDYALSFTGNGGGWDWSLNLSRHWQDEPYLDASAVDYTDPNTTEADFQNDAVLRHARVTLAGFGIQRSLGGWVFKQEAALLSGVAYTTSGLIEPPLAGTPVDALPLDPLPLDTLPVVGVLVGGDTVTAPMGSRTEREYQALLGAEYFGIKYTTLSLEVSARHIDNFDLELERSGYHEWRGETALRLTRDFLRDRLRTLLIAVWFHQDGEFWRADGGAIYRASGEYDFGQGLVAAGGLVLYQSGNQQPFTVSGDNDRVFAELKWSF